MNEQINHKIAVVLFQLGLVEDEGGGQIHSFTHSFTHLLNSLFEH